jgi:hypothetical protein
MRQWPSEQLASRSPPSLDCTNATPRWFRTARFFNDGRGRDEDFSSPPVQIPACAANAPGSSLGFWRRSGDRVAGVSF